MFLCILICHWSFVLKVNIHAAISILFETISSYFDIYVFARQNQHINIIILATLLTHKRTQESFRCKGPILNAKGTYITVPANYCL